MTALDCHIGLEVHDLATDAGFLARPPRAIDAILQLDGIQRISRTFAESPERVLQELTDIAVSLCGADSAGVSLEATDALGRSAFHWAATSGEYAPFLNAMLPYAWMPCGITLQRMRPQLVRVPADHFRAVGIDDVAPITDGMLLPWQAGVTRGTVWILAHGRAEAFDSMDYRVMQVFADLAATAVRHQQQQRLLLRQAEAASAAAMAHELAHQINNPLQKIINSVFLAATDTPGSRTHIQQAASDLHDLSAAIQQLLAMSNVGGKVQERSTLR